MKKILSALLAAVLLLSATACAAHEPVLPPVRESQYPTHSILAKYYDCLLYTSKMCIRDSCKRG